MKDIAIYALEVIVCSGILLSFYRLLLERKAGFKICRFTLLGSLALSTIIPILQIPVWEGETVYIERTKPHVIEQAAPISSEAMPIPEFKPIVIPDKVVAEMPFMLQGEDIVLAVYLLGVAISLAIMIMQLLTIRRLRKSGEIVSDKNPRIIGVNEDISSFSFFNTIYISKCSPDLHTEAIIEHECSHIAHHHSLERIIMELLRAAQWWNPFAWISHKLLIETHEFEADSDVIARGFDQKQYLKTILSSILGYSPEITNGLRNSLTKKRFYMITHDRKSSHSLLRALILIPVLAVLVCTFSFTAGATRYVVQDAASEQAIDSESPVQNTTPAVIEQSLTASDTPTAETINLPLEAESQQIETYVASPAEPADNKKQSYSGELYSAHNGGLTKYPTYDGKDFNEAIKLVRNSVKMPKESIKLGNSGMTSVKAILETDGTISSIKDHVVIDEYMSKELQRAVKKLKGEWQPAEINGKKVRSLIFFVGEFFPDLSTERENIVNIPATANIKLVGSEFVDAKYDGGDMAGLNEWIIANYKPYGEELANRSICGDVELTYVITAEGKIALHQVHQLPYIHRLADQIIEFAQSAPGKITPATSNGKAIDSYNFLKFDLQSQPKANVLNETEVLDVVIMPQVYFQGGGKDKFRNYLKENITYPEEALNWGITGRVAFQFAVEENRVLINFYPPYNAALANEVRRVVESSAEYWQHNNIPPNFMCSVDFCIEQDGKLHCVIPEYLKTWNEGYTNIIPPTIITGKLDPNSAPAIINKIKSEAAATTSIATPVPDNEVKAEDKPRVKNGNKVKRNNPHADVVIGHPKQDKTQGNGKLDVVISKITITNKNTVVRLDIRTRSGFTEVWLESNTYLKVGDKKYMIRDMMVSDNGTWWKQSAVNKKHRISSSGEISIEATFAPIPKNTRILDFVEEDGWVIRNIILQDENIIY